MPQRAENATTSTQERDTSRSCYRIKLNHTSRLPEYESEERLSCKNEINVLTERLFIIDVRCQMLHLQYTYIALLPHFHFHFRTLLFHVQIFFVNVWNLFLLSEDGLSREKWIALNDLIYLLEQFCNNI